jgi:hypothetical protein
MLAGAALLAILDASILSPAPDMTRAMVALVVTVLVGGFIVAVWRSNSKMEKSAGDAEKRPEKGGKRPAGRSSAR